MKTFKIIFLIIALFNFCIPNPMEVRAEMIQPVSYFEMEKEVVPMNPYAERIERIKALELIHMDDLEKKSIPYEPMLHDVIIVKGKEVMKKPIFSWQIVDDKIARKIVGSSWKKDAPVQLSDLAYLELTYWGYDEKEHRGEMIVHSSVAEEVLDIFKELYDNKYYIEKIRLMDEYDADDNRSMADNNTSSFCYRSIVGSSYLSKHAYGLAIDINPLVNPYIKGQTILPQEGSQYKDRSLEEKGMIKKGDICYNAFSERGWKWGGDWHDPKDYQHFEKIVQ